MFNEQPHRRSVPRSLLFAILLALSCVPAMGIPAEAAGPEIRIEPLTLTFNRQARQPIYVEIDWMEDGTHSHRPSQAVIDRIVQTFAAAGFTIHIDVSNAIPHQGTLAINNSVSGSASVATLMAQNFNHAADSHYYYSIWGHNYSYNGTFTTSSGIADLPGPVHLVTLGSFSGQTGTFSNQVGTFVHEFGHNLGQRHGGDDHENYKPNYLSVMNYFYQLSGVGPTLLALRFANTASGFDDFSYSHGLMPSLNEANLDESFGIGLGRPVDWNCSGVYQSGLAKDLQASNFCGANGGLSVLSDFDNWSSLAAQIRALESLSPPPPGPPVSCITLEEYRPIQRRIDELRDANLLPPDGPGPELPVLTAGDAGHSFLIFNDGDSPLTVSSMSLDVATSWIHWEPLAPFTVAPGRSQEVLVFADFGLAPAGQITRRLLVQSNDADESPYPGGVNLVVTAFDGTPCYALTRIHTGSGADPVATPGASSGCPAGQYHIGEAISLTAAPAAGGWYVAGWSGTSNDGSTSTTNSLTMPAASLTVSVAYTFDTPLVNGVGTSGSLPASSPQASWQYYYFDLPAGSSNLVVDLYNLTGDADLYVLRNAKPTLNAFDCRPFIGGVSSEQCNFASPVSGRWWIGVNNFDTGTIGHTIRATWTGGNLIFMDGFESGSTSAWSSSAGLGAGSPP
jgi:Bacterial pre-peptidase C-terminal domain/Divergent InlB B-repeat domain